MAKSVSQRGFTLAELVAVLLIVGILAFAVVPRFSGRNTYDARAFFDQTKAMVRYAQKLSIAGNRSVFVRFSATSVALCLDAGCSQPVAAPAQNSGSDATLAACGGSKTWYCEGVPANVSYTALDGNGVNFVGGSASLYFNPLGRPFRPGDSLAVSSVAVPVSVSVAETPATPASTRTFVIEPETGYVHL